MAAIDWPEFARGPLVGTLQARRQNPFVNDAVQAGAPRRRKVFTRTLRGWDFVQPLDDNECALMELFIDTTTDGGVLPFNWRHPVTAAWHEVRLASSPDLVAVTFNFWHAPVTVEEI